MEVTASNVELYISKVVEYFLVKGISKQVMAFKTGELLPFQHRRDHSLIFSYRAGFSTIFPVSDLCIFTPEELVLLFGNPVEDWSIEST